MNEHELMEKFRELAAQHGWTVDWDRKGDQYGDGNIEYQVWLRPSES